MSANGLKGAEAGKALGDAIAANTVLKELDISGGLYDRQKCDVEFVKTFSIGLRDNGALSCPTGDNHFQAKKQFLKTTSTCKHCGHHEDKHIKVGLTCMHLQRKFQPDVLAVIFVTRGR
jgi:hypothetical protein